MITIKDLSEYDIKSLDVNRVFKSLLQRRDILANLFIIAITVFLSFKMYGNFKAQTAALQADTGSMIERFQVISEYEATQKSLKKFVALAPKAPTEVNTIIEEISEIASQHNVQIVSFSPNKAQDYDFYTSLNIRLSISANSYQSIGLFIRDIEKSPYNLRVENWSAVWQETYDAIFSDEQGQQGKITVDMEIASINLLQKE